MSVFIQDEEAVVDVERAGKMMLQDILTMSEPERTYYIKAWIDYGQFDDTGGMVKLRNPEGRVVKIPYGGKGKFMTFPYQGKEVSRRAALQILRDFGQGGYYHGVDMGTGMSRDSWEALKIGNPEIAAQYKEERLSFNEHHLEQVPYGAISDEVDEADLTE